MLRQNGIDVVLGILAGCKDFPKKSTRSAEVEFLELSEDPTPSDAIQVDAITTRSHALGPRSTVSISALLSERGAGFAVPGHANPDVYVQ